MQYNGFEMPDLGHNGNNMDMIIDAYHDFNDIVSDGNFKDLIRTFKNAIWNNEHGRITPIECNINRGPNDPFCLEQLVL